MKIRPFVSVSSLLLATWLGATFIQKVPAHRYPLLGKDRSRASALVKETEPAVAAHQPDKDAVKH
ncbi:MAG: hypothetical protein QM680_00845 [Luteolibacter sp.]